MENKEGKKKKKKFKKRQVFNIHPVKACYFISHRVWFVLLCMYDIHTQGRPVYSSQGSKKFIITLYMRILHMYEQQWNQVCFFISTAVITSRQMDSCQWSTRPVFFLREGLNSLGVLQLIIVTILQLVHSGLCRRRRGNSAHKASVG